MEKRLCECCQKRKISHHNKYCSYCAVYTKDMRGKISGLKSRLKKLRIKVYGQKNGSERIRL